MTSDKPQDPTLLLKLLREKKKAAGASAERRPAAAASFIPRCDRSRPLPVSFAQERLWLLDRLSPGASAFNMPIPLRLRGRLEVGLLVRALEEIERRHESLRTTFQVWEEGIFQVLNEPRFRLEKVDLGAAADPAAALAAAIEEEARFPFDLERGPLFRGLLLRLADHDHVLVLNVHHVISDGWSSGVLFRELRTLLTAFADGAPSPLPPLALQYCDFAVWQRASSSSEAFAQQLSYWRGRLAGASESLALPTDRPRPPQTGSRSGALAQPISAATTAALRQLASRHGCSLFMPLLTAWKVLLYRLSGQQDILVGTPVAGRNRRELEDLIGIFLNTLVLRTQLAGELAFRQALLRVRDTVLGATANQDVPFEQLLIELQPERHLSQSPFFQVFFNMANIPDLRFELPGLEVALEAMPEIGSKFDLNLYVFEDGDALALSLVYNPDLFDRARLRALLAQYLEILEQAVAEPETRLDDFDLARPALAILPDPRAPLAATYGGGIAEVFAARAAAQPRALAVSDGARQLDYGELFARVGNLAARLTAAGVAPGQVVAIWAQRSCLLPEALLGILHHGSAFVVLDPGYPAPRLLDFLELARPAAVLLLEDAPAPPAAVAAALPARRLEVTAAAVAALAAPPVARVDAEQLAYYAFTSGSTGKPKAILGAQGSLTAFLPFFAERFQLGPGDRQSMASALSHDPLQRDVLLALGLGMTVVVPDPEQLKAPGYLARWAREQRITVMNLVPTLLQLLCLAEPGEEPVSLPELRRVLTVGEALKKADVLRLYEIAPAVTCINLYGATETQRALSFLELPRDFVFDSENEELPEPGSRGMDKAVLPLGRGIDGVQLLVLTPRQKLAGIGELGEICFRSRYLARGYSDAAATREKFAPNPFTGEEGDRIYHTGDLGRFLPGGGVEFAGRTDFQVKLRGFRIELQEIEAALRRHPQLIEAVVMLREVGGEERLVAYFTHQGEAPSGRELRELLLATLPDYMVPASWMPLPAFPLNLAGKIDRRALPDPVVTERGERRLPSQVDQQVLAAIFGQLLGRDEIALDDNFFELGGHSLLATQLLSRVRGAFGVALPLRAIFERPTLEAFAAHVQELQQAGLDKAPPLTPRAAALRQRAPLSFSQQRLFFLEQLEPGSNAYLIFAALRLEGRLDPAALSRALARLADRHEALRTRVVIEEGSGLQEIAEVGTFKAELRVRELTAANPEEAAAAALERAIELAQTAIPLDGPRLWQAELLRLAPEQHFFLLAIHHLVADGWSIGVFLRELGALYADESGGEPAALPPLALQPADFAVWERDWLRGEALTKQLAFWRQHLEGAPAAIELPTDFLRPATPSYRGQRLPVELPAELAAGLREFGRAHGATLFMVLLAGLDTLLAQLSGQRTVVVGTPIAHRERTELEGLIGFFANTLPLRLEVEPEIGFAELLARLRKNLLEAYSHQDLPFEKLVAELGVERDLARAPIFQVMFGLQNVAGGAASWGEAQLTRVEVPLGRSQFDLQWTVIDSGSGALGGFFEWSTDLFAASTVERWSRRLLRLFAAVLADPQRKLAALDLRLDEDRAFAAAFCATQRAYELGRSVFERVAAHAAEAPAAPALGLEGVVAYSYGELDQAAKTLARQLRRAGVGSEQVVGLAIGRLPSLVVAQLAIWQAGAAYLPLDPIYPADRLQFMFEDSGARVLLIDSRGEKAPASLLERAELVIDLAAAPAPEAEAGEAPPPSFAGAHSLAYVLYTSGSTGKPKGVMIEHGALVNFLLSMAEKPGLGRGDVLLSLTTMSFDISGLEIWLPLLAGARVELAGRETLKDATALAALIDRSGATFVQATPATWRLLLDGGWHGAPTLKALCGGEALPGELAERLLAKVGSLFNVYGPTETTIWSTLRQVEKGALPAVVPLGAPIANTAIRLFDRAGHELAPGIAGELRIGGAGLARGYLGRPALTAERFVPDPGASEAGARLYRSGDLARLRMDGELEFLGRLDFQVKVRGFRIELGEIEATLEKHPAVAQAVVVAASAPGGSSRLVGYYRLREGEKAEAYELQTYLHQSLPEYMVPPLLVRLEAFPLTPNLKVDRKSLPAPEAVAAPREKRPPQTENEKILAAIWQDLLETENPSLDDNYFALGGDSVLVIQVVARARKQNLEIAPRDLFMAPTLEALAAIARRIESSQTPEPEKPRIEKQGVEMIGTDLSDEDLAGLLDSLSGG